MSDSDILVQQLDYYRAIAREYEDHAIDAPGQDDLLSGFDGFQPHGDLLELACGPGIWTERLLQAADTVTAVDGAPEMLARARSRLVGLPVRFVEADLFSWQPDRRYDCVFFGFWLSHVPEGRFDHFWGLVDHCLKPEGRVFFVDDNHRTEAELIEGSDSEVVERLLKDGTAHRAIKVPYRAEWIEDRLRQAGWDLTVRSSGPFYWGSGTRAPAG